MKSLHRITKVALACAAAAVLSAIGCAAPSDAVETTQSSTESIVVARRTAVVGGWGGYGVRRAAYVGYPVYGPYRGIW
jgi:hypothetical protein